MPTNELAFDGFQVGKCSVIRVNNIFKMWYEEPVQNRFKMEDRLCHIV